MIYFTILTKQKKKRSMNCRLGIFSRFFFPINSLLSNKDYRVLSKWLVCHTRYTDVHPSMIAMGYKKKRKRNRRRRRRRRNLFSYFILILSLSICHFILSIQFIKKIPEQNCLLFLIWLIKTHYSHLYHSFSLSASIDKKMGIIP
jgi:hypothetical protein